MSNWRRFKNAAQTTAIAATILSSALTGTAEARGHAREKTPSRKPASADDFKFPIVLCRFKQAVLKDSGGVLKVVVDRDWGPEYAFPVGNVRATDLRADNGQAIHAVNGDFSGSYEIQGSPYRLRLEGVIEQGLDLAGNHQLRLRTVLEKKLDKADSSGKLWQEVGNSSNAVIAKTQTDGTVWENVYPYTFNSTEMQRYMSGGKLKQDLVIAGIRDGLLEKGSVFKVGPACGFLDGRTAKSVASAEDKLKFRAIFDKIPDAANAGTALAASAPAEPKKVLSLKLPESASQTQVQAPEQVQAQASNDSSSMSGAVRDEQEEQDRLAREAHAQAHQEAGGGQDLAQGQLGQAGQPGQAGMTPELQAQLAQQSQLADQAAAAYNMQSQQAQNGQLPVDGRDPASSGIPQANNMGQIAQNIQNLQSPEQVQQNLNMLEQQKAALAQQQAMIDQQQQFLAQRQQDLAASGAAQGGADPANNASQPEQIQSSQAAPQAAPVGQSF